MKRKITYLLKDFDSMMKEILIHTKDNKSQIEFIKNKEQILKEVDKMLGKYDKIIEEIQQESDVKDEKQL